MRKLLLVVIFGILTVSGFLFFSDFQGGEDASKPNYNPPEGFETVSLGNISEDNIDFIWFRSVEGEPYVLIEYENYSSLYSSEGKIREGDFKALFELDGEPAMIRENIVTEEIITIEGNNLTKPYSEIKIDDSALPQKVGEEICFIRVIGDTEQPICGGEEPFESSYSDVEFSKISGQAVFKINKFDSDSFIDFAYFYDGENLTEWKSFTQREGELDSNLLPESIIEYKKEPVILKSRIWQPSKLVLESKHGEVIRNLTFSTTRPSHYEIVTIGDDIYSIGFNWSVRAASPEGGNFYRNKEVITQFSASGGVGIFGSHDGKIIYLQETGNDSRLMYGTEKLNTRADWTQVGMRGGIMIINDTFAYPVESGSDDDLRYGEETIDLDPYMFPLKEQEMDRLSYLGTKDGFLYLLFETD